MQPELDLGPITLQTFGLVFGFALVVGGVLAAKRFRELGKPADWAFELAFANLIGDFVGARMWSVAESWSELNDDLVQSLLFDGGLVWYGGGAATRPWRWDSSRTSWRLRDALQPGLVFAL